MEGRCRADGGLVHCRCRAGREPDGDTVIASLSGRRRSCVEKFDFSKAGASDKYLNHRHVSITGSIPDPYRLHTGSIPALYRLYTGSIPALYWLYTGSILCSIPALYCALYWRFFSPISAPYRLHVLHVGSVSALYRLCISVSALYRRYMLCIDSIARL